MTPAPADPWITRILRLYDKDKPLLEFTVGVTEPLQSRTNPWDWECEFFVSGFAELPPTRVYGGDGIGAVQTALNVLGAHLFRVGQTHDIRWFSSRQPGFETYRLYEGPDREPFSKGMDSSPMLGKGFKQSEHSITRELEHFRRDGFIERVIAAISRPIPLATNPWLWECKFLVEGFAGIGPMAARGPDGMAAAQAAMSMLDAYLFSLAQRADIRWLGSRDLGFGTYRAYERAGPP